MWQNEREQLATFQAQRAEMTIQVPPSQKYYLSLSDFSSSVPESERWKESVLPTSKTLKKTEHQHSTVKQSARETRSRFRAKSTLYLIWMSLLIKRTHLSLGRVEIMTLNPGFWVRILMSSRLVSGRNWSFRFWTKTSMNQISEMMSDMRT